MQVILRQKKVRQIHHPDYCPSGIWRDLLLLKRNSSVGLSRRTSCTWKVKPEKHMGEKAEVAAELESDGKEDRKKLSPKIVENAEGDPGWADDTGGKWKGVSLEKNGREGMKSKTYEVGSSLWGSASPGNQESGNYENPKL